MLEKAFGLVQALHRSFYHFRKLNSIEKTYGSILIFSVLVTTLSFLSIVHHLIENNFFITATFVLGGFSAVFFVSTSNSGRYAFLSGLLFFLFIPYLFLFAQKIPQNFYFKIIFFFILLLASYVGIKNLIEKGAQKMLSRFSFAFNIMFFLFFFIISCIYGLLALRFYFLTNLFPSRIISLTLGTNFGHKLDLVIFLTLPVLTINSAAVFEYVSSEKEIVKEFYLSLSSQITAFVFYLYSVVPNLLLSPIFYLINSDEKLNRFLESIGLESEDYSLEVIEGKPIVDFSNFLEAMRKEFLYAKDYRYKPVTLLSVLFQVDSSKSIVSFAFSPLDIVKANCLVGKHLDYSEKGLIKECSQIVIEGDKKQNRWLLTKIQNSTLRLYLKQCSSKLGQELEEELSFLYKDFLEGGNYKTSKNKLRKLDERIDISKITEKDSEILEEKLSILNYFFEKDKNFVLIEFENAKSKIIESQNCVKPKFRKIREEIYVPNPFCYINRVFLNRTVNEEDYNPAFHSPLFERKCDPALHSPLFERKRYQIKNIIGVCKIRYKIRNPYKNEHLS
ncbi:hypothetical protein AKJ43_03420 [candidate division MSBL1 archaeon SCGC-AAA261D19]|uniref:Uncharacterized protein n=1 Tax=candidate division MSBL1 archaeon SCGC-AAA261D19 TaxID=1698273 RepID=A0A133V4N2_9EURY|nr:hypothetical protein AKJ43_03420 [candidate division MSBL1 archaeon SCGC-AAA261D19]